VFCESQRRVPSHPLTEIVTAELRVERLLGNTNDFSINRFTDSLLCHLFVPWEFSLVSNFSKVSPSVTPLSPILFEVSPNGSLVSTLAAYVTLVSPLLTNVSPDVTRLAPTKLGWCPTLPTFSRKGDKMREVTDGLLSF
jgi:hypothetical protein